MQLQVQHLRLLPVLLQLHLLLLLLLLRLLLQLQLLLLEGMQRMMGRWLCSCTSASSGACRSR